MIDADGNGVEKSNGTSGTIYICVFWWQKSSQERLQFITRFIFVVLLCYFYVSTLSAQAPEVQTARSCSFKELFNRSGWEIPGLKGAVSKLHGPYKSEGIPENVFIEILEPQTHESSITFAGPDSGQPDRLDIVNRSVNVLKIERFMMNGHVFGYRVTAEIAGYDKDHKRLHFGSVDIVYYYDPDGSGVFSVQRDAGALSFKIIVPDWVKQAPST